MLSSSGVGGWERMDVLAGCLLNAQPAHCCSLSGNDDYFYVLYTSDIYYHGVDTTSSSFIKEQCDYPDPPE